MPDDAPMFPDFGGLEASEPLAKMGLAVLRNVIRDGGTMQEAAIVLTAVFTGMFASAMQNQKDDSDES